MWVDRSIGLRAIGNDKSINLRARGVSRSMGLRSIEVNIRIIYRSTNNRD